MSLPEAVWLGRVPHAEAVELQEARRARVLAGDDRAQAILLCEHDPVITLGRNAERAHVLATDAELAAAGVTIAPASRGGDVTYHGPGQLMIYPVVRVKTVIGFLERVAGALAIVCNHLGVAGASWRRDPAGLWLGDRKLAACGIHLRRGVAVHGWALNVATPARMWSSIVPCGLATSPPPISIEEAGGRALSIEAVAAIAGPIVSACL